MYNLNTTGPEIPHAFNALRASAIVVKSAVLFPTVYSPFNTMEQPFVIIIILSLYTFWSTFPLGLSHHASIVSLLFTMGTKTPIVRLVSLCLAKFKLLKIT